MINIADDTRNDSHWPAQDTLCPLQMTKREKQGSYQRDERVCEGQSQLNGVKLTGDQF